MDDVHYLKKHAAEESFLFVVDSSRRDTAAFPLPHEYEVQFHAPFRNVVGLDLIDATVPRTEYLVEAGRNTLVYKYAGATFAASITPGDYSILQLVEALNAALAPRLAVEPTTTPAEVSNKVTFKSDAAFEVLGDESTLRRALGLGVGVLRGSTLTKGILGPRTVVAGPLPSADTAGAAVPVRQAFTAPAAGTMRDVQVYVSSAAAVQVRVAVVDAANTLVAHGAATTGAAEFEQLTIVLESVGPLIAGATYHIVLTGSVSVFCGGPGVSTAASSASGGLWWNVTDWSGGSAAMCLDATMVADGYVAESPGVVDLTGESYVLVRCPEIEQQLYRDRAYETVHAGMGLVKLGNYGFREQRFDFVSFPPRRLPTPIGKLSKLTFRLEKSDGSLYDTKGVDHHLVLVVRYLEMTKGPESMTSTLNPAYQPNPLHYLQRMQTSLAPVPRPSRF